MERFESEEALWPRVAKGDLDAADELARCTYRTIYASLLRTVRRMTRIWQRI